MEEGRKKELNNLFYDRDGFLVDDEDIIFLYKDLYLDERIYKIPEIMEIMPCEDIRELFFDVLTTIEERIEFLRNYDFTYEYQPDGILSWFEGVSDSEADTIANIFLDKIGPIILCIESSRCDDRFTTIVDIFNNNEIDCSQLKLAFRNTGFLCSSDCDPRTLFNLYYSDLIYDIHIDSIVEPYNYTFIKEKNKAINKEIIEHIYHPSKLQKWVDDGNEPEDYMN